MFAPKTTAALTLVDAMSGDASHDIDAALTTELRSHFSEQELGEIILLCGQANLNNRVGNAAKQLLGD
ncbi:MAG: alkylhydroperoxidase family enzyme [Paracrocinitomix sp.]